MHTHIHSKCKRCLILGFSPSPCFFLQVEADAGCKEEADLKDGKQNGVEEKTEVDIEI